MLQGPPPGHPAAKNPRVAFAALLQTLLRSCCPELPTSLRSSGSTLLQHLASMLVADELLPALLNEQQHQRNNEDGETTPFSVLRRLASSGSAAAVLDAAARCLASNGDGMEVGQILRVGVALLGGCSSAGLPRAAAARRLGRALLEALHGSMGRVAEQNRRWETLEALEMGAAAQEQCQQRQKQTSSAMGAAEGTADGASSAFAGFEWGPGGKADLLMMGRLMWLLAQMARTGAWQEGRGEEEEEEQEVQQGRSVSDLAREVLNSATGSALTVRRDTRRAVFIWAEWLVETGAGPPSSTASFASRPLANGNDGGADGARGCTFVHGKKVGATGIAEVFQESSRAVEGAALQLRLAQEQHLQVMTISMIRRMVTAPAVAMMMMIMMVMMMMMMMMMMLLEKGCQ